MGNKVDISEVIDLFNDFTTASTDLKSHLKVVETHVEELYSMDSFAGMAATAAKNYFHDLHKILLKSFDLLLTEIEERMESNLNSFNWDVDASESAIIHSGYLLNTEESIKDIYEPFSEEQETIRETLANVSDISSASQPYIPSFDRNYKDAIKIITDLEETLESYTNRDVENISEIDELLHHIETTIKDSGSVTEDNRFIYSVSSPVPTSLLSLMGYNQKKHREMYEVAKESRDSAIKNMDESSQEIASKALKDLDDGIIEEDEYYVYLDELRKLNNEENVDEQVSENFIRYVMDNMDGVSDDLKNNSMAGMIKIQFEKNGYDKLSRAKLISDMNAGKPGAGAFMKEQGKKSLKIGRAVTSSLAALTIGVGTFIDYNYNDKTIGEAGTKNTADAIITGTISAEITATVLSTATATGSVSPIGWAVLAGIGSATVVSTGFNFAYDSNFLGLQTGLDWVGQKIDGAGEALSSFFNAVNPLGTN